MVLYGGVSLLLFFSPTSSANFKPCKSKHRVRRLWIFLHADIGLILLYLKIQYLFNCLFCNGSWMCKLGRHWYFLNLVFFAGKCPAKDKFRPNQDMTSRKRILYPFMLPRGRAWSEDVNGKFIIVLKEASIRKRGQPRPEAPGTNFVRIPLGPVATSNDPEKYSCGCWQHWGQ